MASLTSIEGIGSRLASKFKDQGIRSVETLLEEGNTQVARMELASATGIDEDRILRFVNHADLMRIKGVGGEYAELLEAAGVDTVVELARRNPENLHEKIVQTNEKKSLVRVVPPESSVVQWVKQAKNLRHVIQH